MKRIMRIVLAGLLIASIGGGGYFYYRSRAAGDSTAGSGMYTQTVRVTRGDLSSGLSVVGQLEAVQSASLAFDEMSGSAELLSLAVEAGNNVTEGQVLATIDPALYEQALDQAVSDLQAAEETLAELQESAAALEVSQADVAVARARQALEQAKADLAELADPDLTSLQAAVQDAQDNLALLQIRIELADHDSLAKRERDLQYSVTWRERRIAQLQALAVPSVEERAELEEAKEALAEAQADLAQVQAERELGRQSREIELAQARLTLSDAQTALAEARAGGDAVALAQAQLAVAEAEVGLQAAAEARQALEEGASATELAAARAAVEKKRLAVSEAEAALAGTKLAAPFDGTVLETNVRTGGQVTAGTTVLTVANLQTLQVVASVDETIIRDVRVGQSATIALDAYPGQSFTGQVLEVPLQGALQGNVMVYSVPVSLTGAEDLSLLVGMTANVDIEVAHATDVLLLPTLALQRVGSEYQVLVPDSTSEARAVTVEVGASDGTYSEIVSGLSLGDQVLVQLASSDSNNGMRIMGGGLMSTFSRMLGG